MIEREIQYIAKVSAKSLLHDLCSSLSRIPSRHGIISTFDRGQYRLTDDISYVVSEARKAAVDRVPAESVDLFVEWFGKFFWSAADRRRDWQAGIYR